MKNNPEQASFLRTNHYGGVRFEAGDEGDELKSKAVLKSDQAVGIGTVGREELEGMLEQIDNTGYARFSRIEIEKRLRELSGESELSQGSAGSVKIGFSRRRMRVHPVDQLEQARHGRRRS